MSKQGQHELPDFLIQNLSEGKPLSEAEVSKIDLIWNTASKYDYTSTSVDEQWSKFRAQVGAPMEVVQKPKKIFKFEMFRWVAAAVVVLVLGVAINNYYNSDAGFSGVYMTQENKQSIQLPDGSTIVLNKNSELIVNAINDSKRELLLKSGQAYFKVTHNNLPFTVQTPKGKISVLGTEFDVNAYSGEKFAVYLKNGKIEMELKTGKIQMKPGELLKESSNNSYSLQSINDNREYAWIDNKLVFENTTLAEIISVLESSFNVKFVYDEKLKDEKYNVHVEELNAEQVAELLSKLTNSKVSVQ